MSPLNEKIKSSLSTNFMLFCFEWADPASIDKPQLEKTLSFHVEQLFDSQKKADQAKKLGRQIFGQAVSLYFSKFQNSDGIDQAALGKAITMHKKVMQRHLGKETMRYLQLISSLVDAQPEIAQIKRGLLYAVRP
jgi:hypothetical protein